MFFFPEFSNVKCPMSISSQIFPMEIPPVDLCPRNGGTERGQADGFDLETLTKLDSVKDNVPCQGSWLDHGWNLGR